MTAPTEVWVCTDRGEGVDEHPDPEVSGVSLLVEKPIIEAVWRLLGPRQHVYEIYEKHNL